VTGERDLAALIAQLQPRLYPARYEFAVAASEGFAAGTFAVIAEEEGLTRVAESPTGEWARISLGVHSSLEAVGLTALLSSRLADLGISANVIAAFHHDHFFVPWERKDEAVEALSHPQESGTP